MDTWLKKLVAEDDAPESEREEAAKLEWLRAAAKEGFDDIDRGDYTLLSSAQETDDLLRQIHEEVKMEILAERQIG